MGLSPNGAVANNGGLPVEAVGYGDMPHADMGMLYAVPTVYPADTQYQQQVPQGHMWSEGPHQPVFGQFPHDPQQMQPQVQPQPQSQRFQGQARILAEMTAGGGAGRGGGRGRNGRRGGSRQGYGAESRGQQAPVADPDFDRSIQRYSRRFDPGFGGAPQGAETMPERTYESEFPQLGV